MSYSNSNVKIIFVALVILMLTSSISGINWNGNNWALNCDFPGNNLKNVAVRGEDCGGRCATTSGCTHFTWTDYNGGTCWMKKNSVSKKKAVAKYDHNAVCGVMTDSGSGSSGSSKKWTIYTLLGLLQAIVCLEWKSICV